MIVIELKTNTAQDVARFKYRVAFPYSPELLLVCSTLFSEDRPEEIASEFLDMLNSEKGIMFLQPHNVYFTTPQDGGAYVAKVLRVRSFSHMENMKDKTPTVYIGFEFTRLTAVSAFEVLHENKTCDVSMR